VRWIVLEGPRGLRLRCVLPDRRRERTRGLTGIEHLDRSDALLLHDATSVHTFGMRFPLLVARLDRSLIVVDVRRVAPRRLLWPSGRAAHVLECSIDIDLGPGDALRVAQAGQPPSPAAPVTTHEPA
jgi:uncharacterized protein